MAWQGSVGYLFTRAEQTLKRMFYAYQLLEVDFYQLQASQFLIYVSGITGSWFPAYTLPYTQDYLTFTYRLSSNTIYWMTLAQGKKYYKDPWIHSMTVQHQIGCIALLLEPCSSCILILFSISLCLVLCGSAQSCNLCLLIGFRLILHEISFQ